mmetsp:Transcript_17012/g.46122  ORF Transcript_17012/g.46122 Transcript_17012/m.46122 type:complete len:218 (+) Transcript_17012:333-986(+)
MIDAVAYTRRTKPCGYEAGGCGARGGGAGVVGRSGERLAWWSAWALGAWRSTLPAHRRGRWAGPACGAAARGGGGPGEGGAERGWAWPHQALSACAPSSTCPQHCSTSTIRRSADVVPPSPSWPSVISTNSGRQHKSIASSSTYWRAIAIALIAWLTLPAPIAVISMREPSRVQEAIAPASDLASVSLPTLRLRPSRALPTEGRRARLLMMSWTAES